MMPLSASRQVIFHQMLVAARKTVLVGTLSKALGKLDPAVVKVQIARYVPANAQKILGAAGIRDEHVFPVPAVLVQAPTLIGYYRLLLGISQKRFYRKGTGRVPTREWSSADSSIPRTCPI
jgi:XcyI-like restriction endonuclease